MARTTFCAGATFAVAGGLVRRAPRDYLRALAAEVADNVDKVDGKLVHAFEYVLERSWARLWAAAGDNDCNATLPACGACRCARGVEEGGTV